MSRWMYLQGEITYTGDPTKVGAFITGDDLPQGSEGPAAYHMYPNGDRTSIVVDGSLRDRGRQSDIDGVRQWLKRMIDSWLISEAYIEVRVGRMFVCGLYFHDDVFSEITIPPGFVDLADPDQTAT